MISVSSDQQSAQDIYFLEFIENLENRVRGSNWSSLRIWKLEFITGETDVLDSEDPHEL